MKRIAAMLKKPHDWDANLEAVRLLSQQGKPVPNNLVQYFYERGYSILGVLAFGSAPAPYVIIQCETIDPGNQSEPYWKINMSDLPTDTEYIQVGACPSPYA